MYLCTMCIMLYYKANQNKLTNSVNTIGWQFELTCSPLQPYRGQAEYQLYILNTSEESLALKSCGPYMVIRSYRIIYDTLSSCSGLTVYSVADACRLADVQPSRMKATDVSPRGYTGFSMHAIISICLKYNYKIILILSMIVDLIIGVT